MNKYVLVGNPNSGKTTLFNYLTDGNERVGNLAGVTVDIKEGKYKYDKDVLIVDLPGIYSLFPYSDDEKIAKQYIEDEKPDVIINIIDGTNLERNMYLTSQLIELEIPIILAVNMMDRLEKRGEEIDIKILENELAVSVAAISANTGKGCDKLINRAKSINSSKKGNSIIKNCEIYSYAKKIKNELDGKACDFFALSLLDGSAAAKNHCENIEKIIKDAKSKLGEDIEMLLIHYRYREIEKLKGKILKKQSTKISVTDMIDKVVTNKFLAVPVFIIVMSVIFYITFGGAGGYLSRIIGSGVVIAGEKTAELLKGIGASEVTISFFKDGLINGVGMLFSFMPQIILLMFFMAVMEDSGYLVRAAFITDRLLNSFGLSGKAFIPMIMGFGCNTAAIMACRTIENEKEKRLAVLALPFISCSARIPVYTFISGIFFRENSIIVIGSLYLIGIGAMLASGLIIGGRKKENSFLLMEMPEYRIPALGNVLNRVCESVKDFAEKAFGMILIGSVAVWILQKFNFQLEQVENNDESIFVEIGNMLSFIFKPCGFGSGKLTAALISGFMAKEAVLSTLGILYGGEIGEMFTGEHTMAAAYSYMVFILLYTPCIAALSAIKRETGLKWCLTALCYQFSVAWGLSVLVYRLGIILSSI